MFNKNAKSDKGDSSPEIVTYTIFDNIWPKKKHTHQHQSTWKELVEFIRDQEKVLYTDKKDCPLISLCSYGDKPSRKGYLRHAENVEAVYGIELDYDDGTVTPEEAHDRLKKQRIRSVIYTSPSYKPDFPKWRALLPLSRPCEPERRADMVGRANRILGGIVARESFTLSQSFFIGHVRKAEYLVYESSGKCIDTVEIRPQYAKKGTGADADTGAFDDTPDDAFIEAFEKGSGRYNAVLALTSRWIAKGRDSEKVRRELHKFVRLAEHDGVEPVTSQNENLYKVINRCVASAYEKFGNKKADKKIDKEDVEELDDDDFWLSIDQLSETPHAQEFVIDEWLTLPNVGLYSAHGGSGKSYIALEIAVRVALGVSVFGKDVKSGKVFYFSAEDDKDAIHRRIRHITKNLDVSVSKLEDKLFIRDATKDDTVLFCAPRKFGDEPYTTPRYRMLRKLIKEHDPVLVILDNAVDHFSGNENDRVQVRTFIRKLFKLSQIGSGRNILLLAHVDAGSLKDAEKAKGFSGSTAWHNSVRNLWYQFRDAEDQDKYIIQLKKINYGAPGARVITQFDTDKMVFDIGKAFRPSFVRYERRLLEVVRNCIDNGEKVPCAIAGTKTAVTVLREQKLCPSELRAHTAESKRIINDALSALVKEGALKRENVKTKKGKDILCYVLGPNADGLYEDA